MKLPINTLALLLAAAGFTVGCQQDAAVDGSAFPADTTLRAPQRFADIQAAAGARADATLTADHFTGDRLNSLGLTKLDAMVADDDDAEPMSVYVNLPDSPRAETRRAAVRAYLVDAGLRDNQIDIQTGTNPQSKQLASFAAAKLYKPTENGFVAADGDALSSAAPAAMDAAPIPTAK